MDWIGGGSGVAECATVGTVGTGVRAVVGTVVKAGVFTVVGTGVFTVVGDEDGVFVTVVGVVIEDWMEIMLTVTGVDKLVKLVKFARISGGIVGTSLEAEATEVDKLVRFARISGGIVGTSLEAVVTIVWVVVTGLLTEPIPLETWSAAEAAFVWVVVTGVLTEPIPLETWSAAEAAFVWVVVTGVLTGPIPLETRFTEAAGDVETAGIEVGTAVLMVITCIVGVVSFVVVARDVQPDIRSPQNKRQISRGRDVRIRYVFFRRMPSMLLFVIVY